MSRPYPWMQYMCEKCYHINFVPPSSIRDAAEAPCAHCGETALAVLDVAFYIKMPTFRSSKPDPKMA